MPAIEGFGDEIFTALVAVVITLAVYVAWRTTRVPVIASPYVFVRHHSQPHEVEIFVSHDSHGADQALVVNNRSATSQPIESVATSQTEAAVTDDESNNEETGEPQRPVDEVQQKCVVRLRFLDETYRSVTGYLSQRVGDFRRENFYNELQEGKVIRLIYGGQLLRDDCRSLASYGLFDNCVVHCHIGTAPYSQSSTGATSASPENVNESDGQLDINVRTLRFDIGNGVYVIFGMKFACLWAFLYFFPEYFEATSLVSLVFCSCISLFLFTGLVRGQTSDRQPVPVVQSSSVSRTAAS